MSSSLVRRALLVPVLAALLVLAPACTDGIRESIRQPRQSASSTTTPTVPSVPVRLSVTHVSGRLRGSERAAVASQVRRTLTTYARQAFLDGRYPRRSFSGAFSSFTTGAARDARRDEALLTNADLGPTTRSVRLRRATAYVSLLAPAGHPSGASAAVDWVFTVDRGERTPRQVHLRGRLLLTKVGTKAWRIFGYDVSRSTTEAGGGS